MHTLNGPELRTTPLKPDDEAGLVDDLVDGRKLGALAQVLWPKIYGLRPESGHLLTVKKGIPLSGSVCGKP